MRNIYEWLDKACKPLRYKLDHEAAYQELKDHFEDHKEYLESRGMQPHEAEKQALEAMGDPTETGRLLSAAYHPMLTFFWRISRIVIIVLIIIIVLVGVYRTAEGKNEDWTIFGDPEKEILSSLVISADDRQYTYGRSYGTVNLGEYTFTITNAVKCRWTMAGDPDDVYHYVVLVLKAKGPIELDSPQEICDYITAKDDTGVFYDNIRKRIKEQNSDRSVNMTAYYIRKWSNSYYGVYIENTEPNLQWIDLIYDHMGQSVSLRALFDEETVR